MAREAVELFRGRCAGTYTRWEPLRGLRGTIGPESWQFRGHLREGRGLRAAEPDSDRVAEISADPLERILNRPRHPSHSLKRSSHWSVRCFTSLSAARRLSMSRSEATAAPARRSATPWRSNTCSSRYPISDRDKSPNVRPKIWTV